jgi:hypothetical protein
MLVSTTERRHNVLLATGDQHGPQRCFLVLCVTIVWFSANIPIEFEQMLCDCPLARVRRWSEKKQQKKEIGSNSVQLLEKNCATELGIAWFDLLSKVRR